MTSNWSECSGMGGRNAPEWVVGLNRNRWTEWLGIRKWKRSLSRSDREHIQHRAFNRMSYDTKLKYCVRPEEIDGPSEEAWDEINSHLGTNATNLQELVQQLGRRRFGHIPKVGDAFCGGGNIPFEAGIIGCESYGADLSPVSALLTWASINIVGGGEQVAKEVFELQKQVYEDVESQVDEWGIERNDEGWYDETTGELIGQGWKSDYYLYCFEVVDPITGWRVPLAASWIIGQKTRTIARLRPDAPSKSFRIEIIQNASTQEMQEIQDEATWVDGVRSPVDKGGDYLPTHLRASTSMEGLFGSVGLRHWQNGDLVPRAHDIFQERLYCIRWINPETGKKYYRAPTSMDLEREKRVLQLLRDRFAEWQNKGYIPSRIIEPGQKTEELIRTRGWTYWHHLYNPRQLLIIGLFQKLAGQLLSKKYYDVAMLLGTGRLANWFSRLCPWDSSSANEKGASTFYNQALNPLANYASRGISSLNTTWYFSFPERHVLAGYQVAPMDARATLYVADLWVTDPPYADAITYEELSELFLSWYEEKLPLIFMGWYKDSKRALAIKGPEESFRISMVECYKRLAEQMPENGLQLVMFTHQDVEVWSDLALILWAAGLRVTAAWTIATETGSALKKGKYIQGTVLLILRKQNKIIRGDMSDIYPELQAEVQRQLKSMLELDDKEDPNFGDSDYQLAAYAAALRVITAYSSIDDIDVERELHRARRNGEESPLARLIRSAVRIASDFLVPYGLERTIWKRLSPDERFYIKGIEIESHGEYRDGVYQEFARGFGVRDYRGLLGSGEANMARLKTPSELRGHDLSGEGFAGSLLRQVLFGVYKTAEEDDPRPGRDYLKQELPYYWDSRHMILALLSYISTKPSATMEHWKKDANAAHLLFGSIDGDGV